MKNAIQKTLLTTLLCLIAASVRAEPVQVKETGLTNGQFISSLTLPIQSGATDYWAGLQTIAINDAKSVLAFCADPWEWSPNANESYSIGSLDGVFGSIKADYIRELYSESYTNTLKSNNGGAGSAAAFQLALWEIIADGDLQLDGNGLVRIDKNTTRNIVSEATAMLKHIDGIHGGDNYSFTLYTSGKSAGQGSTPGAQDYLVAEPAAQALRTANPIPEPGSGLLVATALGAAGLLSLRRRKTTAQA